MKMKRCKKEPYQKGSFLYCLQFINCRREHESMAIRNNKDFLKEYKDDAWKGFSTRELLCIIGAAAIGITVDALLHFYAGISLAMGVYIALPLAVPLILIGFYKYQGFLTVGRFLKEWMYEISTSRVDYISGECVEEDPVYREEAYPDGTRSRKQRKKKKQQSRNEDGGN